MADESRTRGPFVDGPDADGFHGVHFEGTGFALMFGRFLVRKESETRARVRLVPGPEVQNINGAIHGGFMLGFLDQAIFAGPATLGVIDVGASVTLGISTQFVGIGRIGEPLDCVVDVVKKTRQLLFVSGLMEQAGEAIFSYQATLRTFEKRITPQ